MFFKPRWIRKTQLQRETLYWEVFYGIKNLEDTLMIISPQKSTTKTLKEWFIEWGYLK